MFDNVKNRDNMKDAIIKILENTDLEYVSQQGCEDLIADEILALFNVSKCTCKTPNPERIHGPIKACVDCGKEI